MRFIHKWSYACANFLMHKLDENHEKRGIYYYGFQIIIGAIIKGICLVAISFLLGSLIPTLIVVLAFASFRSIAGGYHMDTYGKCIATSLGLFIVAGFISKYTYEYWNIWVIALLALITFVIGIVISIKWAPKDTPNKPITKPEEIRMFKRLSVAYIVIWGVAAAIFLFFKIKYYDMILISFSFGLLQEIFTITPAGHKFFDKISGQVDMMAKKKRTA